MEGSSNCDKACDGESVGMILNEMTMVPKCDLQPLNIDSFSYSDCDVSSVVSMKEDCGSPMSSWDSDLETDISSLTGCHVMPEEALQDVEHEGNHPDLEEENQFVGVENTDDGLLWEMDNKSYEELLKKFIEKEEELRVSNFKLQLSEQEIIGLKVQVEDYESQINDMHEKLELKEDELYEQKELSKEEIFKLKTQIKKSENQLENVWEELSLKNEELQKQTAELDTHIPEFINKITNLMEQVEASQKNLKISKNETANLRKELDCKSSMIHQLQCQIKEEKENIATLECKLETLVIMNEDNDIIHEEELRKMNSTLLDMEVMFSWEKEKMLADTARLSKLRKQLTSKLEEFESRNKELKKKVMRHEAEKSNQKNLHSTQVKLLQDEISCLKKELGQRMNDVEAANKESNKVMIEINEANVKVDKLKAEICSRGDQISHMKKHIDELNTSLKELVVHYRAKVNDENKLIMRVEELEKEVSKQNVVILERVAERANEKKEAVKQLWNSLEYNWSGYTDLFKR